MAKVHDKYVVELAEVIKGYGNDPDINDPFCLSEFYRFYEVPNVCVSAENFKKMRPLNDYTEEIEPESISEWKKEFREYVDSLDIARDDWKGIIEYIDELPSAEPDTTTHDSIPAKTGKNDGDRTSGDCISRQQAIDALKEKVFHNLSDEFYGAMQVLDELPSAQPDPCEDAVSRKAVLSMIDTYMNKSVELHYLPTSDGIKKLISILPSAQPDIIRCKDCEYLCNEDGLRGMCWHINGFGTDIKDKYNSFCSWAEGREDG